MIYLKNGTKATAEISFDDIEDDFYVIVDRVTGKFYPNDSVPSKVSEELIELRETIDKHFFDGNNPSYKEIMVLPSFVHDHGFDSDNMVSKDFFEIAIDLSKTNNPNIIKHMYSADMKFLLDSMASLTIEISDLYTQYYIELSDINLIQSSSGEIKNIEIDGVHSVISPETYRIYSCISNIFVKMYSILDLITKIAYELQNTEYDYDNYRVLKYNKILFGDKKHIIHNNTENTLWKRDELINCIESIRCEIIHNGSWSQPPRVYLVVENNMIVERYVLFPDLTNGHYEKYGNRYHFFSNKVKVNDILPRIYNEFFNRLICSIQLLNDK